MSKISAEKLQTELAKGTLCPVYLLTGEDVYRKAEAIKRLKQVVGPDDFNFLKMAVSASAVAEVLAQANTAPVFSNTRLIILTDIDKLRKGSKEQQALLEYVRRPLPTTVLVLTHNDPKKLKTDKTLSATCEETGRVVNFEELRNEALAAWVREKLTAQGLVPTFEAVDLLCQSVGSELSALENEIEKLALFTAQREDKKITATEVLACIGFRKEENPFELANALTACNKKQALAQIDKLFAAGEDPVGVLSKMTYPILKMARIKRMTQAGLAPSEILRAAGLFPWEGRLVSAAGRLPCEQSFLTALNKLIDADGSFKTGTNTDPKTTLKGIVLTLFK